MPTESQINANRQNAQLSTGPRTSEGKAASSANATRHGLSGAFRVFANENQDEFDHLVAEYQRTFKPTNTHEQFLLEEMVQCRWRLARVRRLEADVIEDMVAQRGFDDADAMMVAALRNDTTHALTTLQRYALAIQRVAFRALDQLLALRKLEAQAARDHARQNEANSRATASGTAGCPATTTLPDALPPGIAASRVLPPLAAPAPNHPPPATQPTRLAPARL